MNTDFALFLVFLLGGLTGALFVRSHYKDKLSETLYNIKSDNELAFVSGYRRGLTVQREIDAAKEKELQNEDISNDPFHQ